MKKIDKQEDFLQQQDLNEMQYSSLDDDRIQLHPEHHKVSTQAWILIFLLILLAGGYVVYLLLVNNPQPL